MDGPIQPMTPSAVEGTLYMHLQNAFLWGQMANISFIILFRERSLCIIASDSRKMLLLKNKIYFKIFPLLWELIKTFSYSLSYYKGGRFGKGRKKHWPKN